MNLNYTNLPNWLENNKLFRKLFLYRKLYFVQASFKHHSQFAEDVTIGRKFRKQKDGFFVDVGCFHPKKCNNTWLLYKRGWRGINIDLDTIKIEGFDLIRPNDHNVCSAVSDEDGEVSYYSNGFYSMSTSMSEDFVQGKTGYVKRTTHCRKLTDIIDDSPYKDRSIDFLTVDAEGHDLQVLKSLDFDRYNPKLIAFESHHRLFDDVLKTDLYQFLSQLGYDLVGWCGLTLLMANADMQKQLTKT